MDTDQDTEPLSPEILELIASLSMIERQVAVQIFDLKPSDMVSKIVDAMKLYDEEEIRKIMAVSIALNAARSKMKREHKPQLN